MKRIAFQFGMTLALLAMLGTARAVAQTPPNEPSDFSSYFVGFDYLALPNPTTQGPVSLDGRGFENFGFWFPGMPGTLVGDWFEDYTNKRERFDVGTTDPNNPKQIATIWKFYDKNLIHLYRYDTGTCTTTSFDETIQYFFGVFATATFEGQTGWAQQFLLQPGWTIGLTGNVWTDQLSRGNSLELGVTANVSETPLYITRYAPGRITRLQFVQFTSGQPDAAVFSLPAACSE